MIHQVIVYSREGCHLCDEVKQLLARLESTAPFTWREVDIDQNPELRVKFNEEVPVVFIDGRKAFKYRMSEREFLQRLARSGG